MSDVNTALRRIADNSIHYRAVLTVEANPNQSSFVSCLDVETLDDSTQSRVNKAMYLEKQNGDWKIVGNLFGIEPSTKPK